MEFVRKEYESYEHYLSHQPQKMKHPKYRQSLVNGHEPRLHWFFEQFKILEKLDLDKNSDIVTLGARFGEEVEALRQHGFHKAFGMDLKEQPPLVIKADMNEFVATEPDNSYDLVYTNSMDHCWDLEEFIKNIERISRKYILIHVSKGCREYEVYGLNDKVAELFEAKLIDREDYPAKKVKDNCGNSYRFLFEI